VQTYFELIISNVPAHLEDDVTTLCLESGAQGVSQKLAWVQQDAVYTPEIIEKDFIDLSAYFDSRPDLELLAKIAEQFSGTQTELLEKPTEDWMEGWKKHFKPFQLVGPFWVVPSWLQPPPEAEVILKIDPGMAFGTGTHATTQIASQLIYDMREEIKGLTAIDVGTGTGILALTLSHLGAEEVEATEIDEMARETAKENIKLNEPNAVKILDYQIEEVEKQFDLVVANIIDGVLVQIKKDLVRMCAPQGKILVTGILEERRETFLLQFLTGTDLVIERSLQKDEWWGFLLKHKDLP
jgi:ribosomal protein L11 methyltransferase